jgi:malonate transporter and related proteins
MPPVLESLIPVFLVMMIGWGTKASGFIVAEQWAGFERVTYYILMPALIIFTLAMTNLSRVPVFQVAIALLAPVILMIIFLVVFRPFLLRWFQVDGPAFTSVLQGIIRWNAFVGLALAAALYGETGLAYASIALATVVPFVNFVSVFALSKYGTGKPLNPKEFIIQLLKNPFITATLIGGMIGLTGLVLPKFLVVSTDIMGKAALSAGLLLVGSGLELKSMRNAGAGLWLGTSLRLIAMPLLTGFVGMFLGLTGAALAVPVICAGVPTAAAAYIMARQSGGDAPLMASIITVQTLGAAVTLPLMLLIFGWR